MCTLAAALEKELQSTAVTVNEEVLKTINVILSNFHKLHISEAATSCIPHLVAALKSGSEAAQDSILTTLCLLKQSWPTKSFDVSRSQATAAAEAIPTLQTLVKTCPPTFRERVGSLLNCLPGCLTVTVIRANNLKQDNTAINSYCRLSIGNGPPRRTKVIKFVLLIIISVDLVCVCIGFLLKACSFSIVFHFLCIRQAVTTPRNGKRRSHGPLIYHLRAKS